MAGLDRPLLRPLAGHRASDRGVDFVGLSDPLGAFGGSIFIPFDQFRTIVRFFDGRSTVDQIIIRSASEPGPTPSPAEVVALIGELDRRLVLDGPAFDAYRQAYARLPVRPPALAGRAYPADPDRLGTLLDGHFAHPREPGESEPCSRAAGLRAVLSPHIDFERGGPTYSWAYRELAERSDAEVFVVLGVAHQPCRHRFALTRKDFDTPLGLARTDRAFVDRLAEGEGSAWFDDELAHRSEHSIEFQVVCLQHALAGRRTPFTIVPILVGSFGDLLRLGIDPIDNPEVARMVDALREAERASGREVAYIGGIDLCHVGPEFGDPGPVDDPLLDQVREFDAAMLDRAVAGDAAGWFARASAVGDRYRVCGLSATYTLLRAIEPLAGPGRLLRYDQAVAADRSSCVSFASAAFDGSGAAL